MNDEFRGPRDTTDEQLRAELERARIAEQRFRGLLESAPDAVVVADHAGSIILVNAQTERLFGYSRAELLGQPVELLVPTRLHDRHLKHRAGYHTAPGVRPMGSGLDLVARRKDGNEIPVEISLSPLHTDDGLLVLATVRDTSERRLAQAALRAARDELEVRVRERTVELEQANRGLQAEIAERRKAEAALRASETQLRLVADNMPAGMAYVDSNQIYLYHNQTFADLLGLSGQDLDGRSLGEFLGEEAYAEIKEHIESALAGKAVRYEQRFKVGKALRCLSVGLSPHFVNETEVNGFMVMLTDVTEQRYAEQVMQQAQKMEAVGQLTGGVAHDFNNLLMVVLGNLQFLASDLKDNAGAIELLEAATQAARRGADLNSKLLAFSRRQRLSPTAINFNDMVEGMVGMLRRTLGEHIRIVVAPGAELPCAMADPTQLETALLNLAVNARDAMERGGTLTIETASVTLDEHYAQLEADVTPGPYVMLAVSDTGNGMEPEVRRRAFEPFFTTKETGKGSGLGLAMVYGFVKQSGGHLKIYSELRHGTTVKLYLPTIQVQSEAEALAAATTQPQPTGHETILVVEDEEDVRRLVCRALGGLGYHVLQAGDGKTALALLKQEPTIDLIFTDVVLPGGVNGPELAHQAASLGRHIKVLYTSGYTGNALQQLDTLAAEIRLITKPYRIEELAQKVRTTLDG